MDMLPVQQVWLAKTILQGTVKGGRREGRQRKRWEGNIREWTGLNSPSPRGQWRTGNTFGKLVKSSVVPQGPSRLRIDDDDDEQMVAKMQQSARRLLLFDYLDLYKMSPLRIHYFVLFLRSLNVLSRPRHCSQFHLVWQSE